MTETRFDIAPVMRELGLEVPDVTGSRWKRCRCPFHDDRTASASVNQWGFRCHSCGRSGDAIKIVQEVMGVEFKDALARAEAATGVEGGRPSRKRRPSSTLLGF